VSTALEQRLGALADWAAARSLPVTTHAYGPEPDQHADLRLPSGEARGLAVVLHGGFWRVKYGKGIMDAFAIALTDAGWATWNVEYRRVGRGGGWPQTFDDVAAARAAAPPAERVVAIGHSAGGHLALLLASRGLVDAAVALGAVCDLRGAAADRLGDGATLAFMGSSPAEAWAEADPLAQAPPPVAVALVHGVDDETVPVAQARTYHAAAGDHSTLSELECGHFEPIDPRSEAWPHVLEALNGVGR
jgi:acetyl esterase/lipase